MTPPRRIQRRRTLGWKMPAGCVCVSRPGKFGNPYKTAAEFREFMRSNTLTPLMNFHRALILDCLPELRGHDLACWCRLCPRHADGLPLGVGCADCSPCHASELLRIANG